jgi:hypothetical protein
LALDFNRGLDGLGANARLMDANALDANAAAVF